MKPTETAVPPKQRLDDQGKRSDISLDLSARFRRIRSFSEELCEPLEREDYVVQSMVDASPAKWHLAHTSWFFETFILGPLQNGYQSAVPEYAYLFNSYYNAAGPMHCRDRRGLISRPTVPETIDYRRHIDDAMLELLTAADRDETLFRAVAPLLELGLNHEQQHQELLLTDIKHLLAQNPLHPVYRPGELGASVESPASGWVGFKEGIFEIGHDGRSFYYDNEAPRHRQFLEPFELASRPVTNGEYQAFMEDGGYHRAELWLSLGWNTVREAGWEAPLYWTKGEGEGDWRHYTLAGLRPVEPGEPVSHVSFFEADAFARWAGARLPTEGEWEVAARTSDPGAGRFVDERRFHPRAADGEPAAGRLRQMFGDVWEWTGSSYRPYPGYRPPEGAVGEYNGKFMCNQMVLRGGSCATSRSHIRPTYRNFFQPDKRWQFSGIRLARETV